jgi:hypothetical protein
VPPTDLPEQQAHREAALPLLRHADSSGGAGVTILAEASRPAVDLLRLRYAVIGDVESLRLPEPVTPERADELWRHTCFEAFVAAPGGYLELNFAPSRRWAAYRFSGYRSGMAAAEAAIQAIDVVRGSGRFDLAVTLDLSGAGLPDGPWSASLTAVVENATGRISYWALAHPPGKPDFHHPDSLVLDLPPPEPA